MFGIVIGARLGFAHHGLEALSPQLCCQLVELLGRGFRDFVDVNGLFQKARVVPQIFAGCRGVIGEVVAELLGHFGKAGTRNKSIGHQFYRAISLAYNTEPDQFVQHRARPHVVADEDASVSNDGSLPLLGSFAGASAESRNCGSLIHRPTTCDAMLTDSRTGGGAMVRQSGEIAHVAAMNARKQADGAVCGGLFAGGELGVRGVEK